MTDNLFDPVGLKPTTPQKDAGILADPAVSEHILKGVQRVATAAAHPPDEPPLMNPLLYGLTEWPQTWLFTSIFSNPCGTLVCANGTQLCFASISTISAELLDGQILWL